MPIIPLTCPMCGGDITIESNNEAAICQFCGKPFVVKDAIVQYYTNNVTNITAESVNVYTRKDFDIQGGTLYDYCGESDEVVVPNGVKVIAKEAFAGKSVKKVIIPDSVEEIEPKAFLNCGYLEDIQLPNNLYEICDQTFYGCGALKKITIPSSVECIGRGAFMFCDSLNEICIPEGVESLKQGAFAECAGVVRVSLPSTIREVEFVRMADSKAEIGIFEKCISLKTIVLTEGIKRLGKRMFAYCKSLTEITIPNSVEKIDEFAFEHCDSIRSITFPEKMIDNIDYTSFSWCDSVERVNNKTIISVEYFRLFDRDSVIGQNTKENWKQNGLSTCCGCQFKGLITKRCSKCGKVKEY